MPSLKALDQFKSSFLNIGGEREFFARQGRRPEDYPLPEHEPAPGTDPFRDEEEPPAESPGAADASQKTPVSLSGEGGEDFIDVGDLGDLLGGADGGLPDFDADFGGSGEGLDADFSDLLNSIPDDPGLPVEESPGAPAAGEPGGLEDFNLEDLSLPAEETPGAPAAGEPGGLEDFNLEDLSLPAEETPGAPASGEPGGLEDFNLEDLSLPAEESPGAPAGEPGGPEDFNLEDLSLPAEESSGAPAGEPGGPEDFNLEDLSLPAEESPGAPAGEPGGLGDFNLEDLSLPAEESPGAPASGEPGGLGDFNLEDLSLPAEESPGAPAAAAEAGHETGIEASAPETGEGAGQAEDSFDAFNLDSGTEGFGLDEEAEEDAAKKEEDFGLPGIDDILRSQTLAGESALDVEELQLSDEDVAKLENTLNSYPLNVRMACEEIIAEQVIAPELLSRMLNMLLQGAGAREAADFAGQILGRIIRIPKGFEKKTGLDLEAEQASFTYIFIHNFLPVFRMVMLIAAAGASLFYLVYRFIYTPLKADSIYKIGIERIQAGEYGRANERFQEAVRIQKVKKWFYRYAEAFRDVRQYYYAEEKYDELLANWPRDKKAVLNYATMETNYLRNYPKADALLRRNILDYTPNDRDTLLALGDNSLAWAELESERYEDAREAYAKVLDIYGPSDPVLERMLKYFIRTDNLKEVLPLKTYFMGNNKKKISPETLAELGGYLLDKRFEHVEGVPDEYLDNISGIREILLRAVKEAPDLPEAYYHLARYYQYFENPYDEQLTLERALEKFRAAPEESVRRFKRHIDAYRRYGEVLIRGREFFKAEEQLLAGARLYEEGLERRLFKMSPEQGRLYADLGDLAYFTQEGDMNAALDFYKKAEGSGYAPPEILYRMGSAYYALREWRNALEYLFTASSGLPLNRRILYALGNAACLRGDYFTAQAYYSRLLDLLETDQVRFPLTMPNDRGARLELTERLMVARNNLGVALEALSAATGDNSYRSRAFGLYAESERAWDALTRNPETMNRLGPLPGEAGPGVNPAYLNVQNALHPIPGYEPQFFYRIDKDVAEPSVWEDLVPPDYRLAQGM